MDADSPTDSTPPVSHDNLKTLYKPSLTRIMVDMSDPASMERVCDKMAHQDSDSTPHPVSEQDIMESNNELNRKIEDSRRNVKLYGGHIDNVA